MVAQPVTAILAEFREVRVSCRWRPNDGHHPRRHPFALKTLCEGTQIRGSFTAAQAASGACRVGRQRGTDKAVNMQPLIYQGKAQLEHRASRSVYSSPNDLAISTT